MSGIVPIGVLYNFQLWIMAKIFLDFEIVCHIQGVLTMTPTTPVGYYTVVGSEFCINVLIILQVQRITMVMHSILVMHKGTQLMM